MPTKLQSGFQVLAGVKLPAEVEKRIAISIRQAVLHEIAALDFKGDLRVNPGLRIDRTWWGIWIDVVKGGRGPNPIGPGPAAGGVIVHG